MEAEWRNAAEDQKLKKNYEISQATRKAGKVSEAEVEAHIVRAINCESKALAYDAICDFLVGLKTRLEETRDRHKVQTVLGRTIAMQARLNLDDPVSSLQYLHKLHKANREFEQSGGEQVVRLIGDMNDARFSTPSLYDTSSMPRRVAEYRELIRLRNRREAAAVAAPVEAPLQPVVAAPSPVVVIVEDTDDGDRLL